MGVMSVARIRCACGNSTRPHLNIYKAQQEAEDCGWEIQDRKYICPKCLKKARLKRVTPEQTSSIKPDNPNERQDPGMGKNYAASG
jgi:hypothetical protein